MAIVDKEPKQLKKPKKPSIFKGKMTCFFISIVVLQYLTYNVFNGLLVVFEPLL